MSGQGHYRANLRDLFFNLFEVNQVGATVLGKGPFGALDERSVKEMLTVLATLAEKELAASFKEGDRTPLRLDAKGDVHLAEGLKASLSALYQGGWHMLEVPEALGGFGAPPSVGWAANEMVVGSNPAAAFYQLGIFMVRIIDRLGTEGQKRRFVKGILANQWGGTMMLSEPQAGSDVGEGRTKAVHVKDDEWHLTGTKTWITNGDFDATGNIIHMVLARPEGAEGGTRGLSLFIVPKFWVNEDGSLGERNGVVCTHIEKKMGIKASSTCVMQFGENTPARGLLVGNVHQGIRQMFRVIEHARMFIGAKSMSTLSAAYFNALAYAKDRVQGGDLAKMADKTSPRVRIIQHPDVRRMLMLQKCHAEGMRALIQFNAHLQDQIELAGGYGSGQAPQLEKLNDLLLPLIKGFCSEKTYELLAMSLQVFGGAGYTQDWPMEQYIRDQKIDTLYEGTTHIQALDLLFRKIARDGGATLMELLARVQKTLDDKEGGAPLAKERDALAAAQSSLEGIFTRLMQRMGESLYHAGLHGNRILFALAQTVIGWLLIRHAGIALSKLPNVTGEEKSFYEGKVASARFFAAEVLPELATHLKVVEEGTLSLMSLPEEAF